MASQTSLVLKRTGHRMPSMGFGVWKIPKADTAKAVVDAIEAGYRHLDCACDYGNEKEVGEGIKQAIEKGLCKREDLWITSKLWNTYHRKEHVPLAMNRTLKDLQLSYVDLYLVHFPIALKFVPFEERYPPEWLYDPSAAKPKMEFDNVSMEETWRAMEALVAGGHAKNIGVCNYSTQSLRDLLNYAKITPDVLQVELHPYNTQQKLIRFCKENDIVVTGFSPLGHASYVELGMADGNNDSAMMENVVAKIAKKHNKTPAQVLLRWGVQRGTAIIPKTVKKQRMVENISVFDFEMTTEEMESIDALNKNRRFNDPGVFCELAFGTYCPIYE